MCADATRSAGLLLIFSLPLLTSDDPHPVASKRREGSLLLTVEHAGNLVPATLGDLGLPASEIERHIGWDPGASALANALHTRLGGTLIEQRYSRLVIDCNRPVEAPDLIAEMSDGTMVPANVGISQTERLRRWTEIHQPYHAEVAKSVAERPRGLASVHTYDPQRRVDGAIRPWPIGLLWRKPNTLADHLAMRLATAPLALPLGINRPYTIDDESDYTIPVHAEAAGLDHVLIEVRNDFLKRDEDVAAMADLLADALSSWSD